MEGETKLIIINGTKRLVEKNKYGSWELYLDDDDIEWLKLMEGE